MQTYGVFQALQSDRRLGSSSFTIPAASYTVFQMLALTVWIPIYDQIILPFLRKITKKTEGISLLQRIGVGVGLAIFTIIVAALVETKRRDVALSKPTLGFEPRKGAISSMSGYWLVLPLAVAGLSEGFAVIGFTEFFYKQFPENMKSFAGSFLFCGLGLSSYLISFLISIVHRTTRIDDTRNWLAEDLNKAKLDYFYYLCAGNETFEKLETIGTSNNLLVYLTTRFNMKSITATNLINVFNGTCNFGTLMGAYLSDTYFGRYKILGAASISSFLGMLVLTLRAAITNLHPPHCADSHCIGPTAGQMAFLLGDFVLLIVGASGIRPCNLAFGADQFNPNTESGKRGINSFFNWYYFTFTFTMMISLTIIVYVQANINWAIGLAIPTFLMFLSCAFFFVGTRIYVKVLPEGSPLTSIFQVLVATTKKRHLTLPDNPTVSLFNYTSSKSINTKLPYSKQFRFLNKAAIKSPNDKINPDGSSGDPWTLCGIQQIEEVKCVIKTVPIWVTSIMYHVSLNQMQTYGVFQALQSDRRLGSGSFTIPAASYTVFQMLALTVWIPIYDRIILPFLRKITKKTEGISLLQRIGVRVGLAIFTMVVAALVETKRRDVALSKPTLGFEPRKGAISSMSGYWLVLPLAIAGLSEGFAVIGFTEFFYKQFPENMKSFAGSFLFCGLGLSSYLSSFLISVVHRTTRIDDTRNWLAEDLNKAKLDYFYYLCAGLEVLNFGYFLLCAKWYKYKGTGDESVDVPLEDMASEKDIV